MRRADKTRISGMTLIEVIIALSILSIVLMTIMSVFSYQLKTYTLSSNSVSEQSSLRLTAYKLTDKLRNIAYINLTSGTIIPTAAQLDANSDECIVLLDKVKNGKRNGSEAELIVNNFSDDEIQNLKFRLVILDDEDTDPTTNRYNLIIDINEGTNNHFSTEVLLNNIIYEEQIGQYVDVDGVSSYSLIEFSDNKDDLVARILASGFEEEYDPDDPNLITVNAALDSFDTLTVLNSTNDNSDSVKPIIQLPSSGAITFDFISRTVSDGAEIHIDTGEVTRTNKNVIGTITLKARLGSVIKTKIFKVNIPKNLPTSAAVTVYE